MTDEIKELIDKCRTLKSSIALDNISLKALKSELRTFMIDSGIKEFDGVEIRRSFSFDVGFFRMKERVLAEAYIKEETITTVKDVLDKKGLKKQYPEIYRKYQVENTARLYGL